VAAIAAPAVERRDFISRARACLDQASSKLAATITDAGLSHFYDIAPHIEAACAETAKKGP
jgi:hypothetical protein